MNKRTNKKKWNLCHKCGQMVFASYGVGNHKCPKLVQEIREAELDAVMTEEMSTWNRDVQRFWNSKETKFFEYLAQTKRL